MTAPSWRRLPERGGRRITRLYIRLCLAVGRRPARPILYAIAAYFQSTAPVARRASRTFLQRARGRPARVWHVYRHLLTFSTTIMDRVFFLAGRDRALRVEVHGAEHFDRLFATGRGFFLMSAHLGSFEAMRALGRKQNRELPIKILMHLGNTPQLEALLGELSPEATANVIALDRPGAMLEVRDWIQAGGIVGILADRSPRGDKLTQVDFLGRPAPFPLGPWLLAATLQAPALLSFTLYRGNGRYDTYFEPFADPVLAEPGKRQAAAACAQRYAARLQAYCQDAPYNWFNFYDFWGESEGRDGSKIPGGEPPG